MYRPRQKSTISCEEFIFAILALQNYRSIRQLVPRPVARWKMTTENRAYGFDAFNDTFFESARTKRLFHASTNAFPMSRADRVGAAVRENFDLTVGEQQINQYTVIVLRVPDVQLCENVECALARGAAV